MNSKIKPPQSIHQTASGDHNIQIAGRQNTLIQIIKHLVFRDTEGQIALRNRRVMLAKVRTTWVKGLLEQSLHGIAMINVGIAYKPEAIQYPWDAIVQQPNRSPCPIPRGTKVIEVFDEVGDELLILGAPGSGKTTMLLDLARDLITRAEEDEKLPIPVVFNLLAWGEKRLPLGRWLVDELWYRYAVPRKIGETWIGQKELVFLLDGLDEINAQHRKACVEAIHRFQQDHGPVGMVVCSRSTEYEEMHFQIRLQSAVVLQPLTRDQVYAYLKGTSKQLSAARELLSHDQPFQELTESPLMLSIMMLAYSGLSSEELGMLDTIDKRRTHLFDTYVRRMFDRRGKNHRYEPQQTVQWLTWLARQLIDHAQTTFYFERIQPDWLSEGSHYACRWLTMLFGGLISGLFIWLFFWLLFGLQMGLISMLIYGMLFGLLAVLVGAFVYAGLGTTFFLLFIMAFGSILLKNELHGVPVVLLSEWLNSRLPSGLIAWLLSWFLAWLLGVFLYGLVKKDEIVTSDDVIWSLSKIKKILTHLFVLMLIGSLSFGSLSGLMTGFYYGLKNGALAGMKNGLIALPLSGLLVGLLVLPLVIRMAKISMTENMIPNEGIWRSAKNAVIMLVLCTIGSGLFTGLIIWILSGMEKGGLSLGLGSALSYGLSFGLFIGLLRGLSCGGDACIQHVILRFFLYRNGFIPKSYIRFLDYCTERIFLRKIGSGYTFIHRLMMEHFAKKGDKEPLKRNS